MDNIEHCTLLPLIMELIAREKNLTPTMDDLTNAIKDAVLEEHIRPFGSLDMAIKFALEMGSNLGILSLTDEVVPIPFNFRKQEPVTTPQMTAAEERQVIRKALKCKAKRKAKAKANARATAKVKAKLCAGKRPMKKVPGGKKRLSYMVGRVPCTTIGAMPVSLDPLLWLLLSRFLGKSKPKKRV